MGAARTDLLRGPRLTLRRMMLYVALIAVGARLATEWPRQRARWKECNALASKDRAEAVEWANVGRPFAEDQIIWPDVGYDDRQGRFHPITGGYARKLAEDYEARARAYESHRWRFWENKPPALPGPLDWVDKLAEDYEARARAYESHR